MLINNKKRLCDPVEFQQLALGRYYFPEGRAGTFYIKLNNYSHENSMELENNRLNSCGEVCKVVEIIIAGEYTFQIKEK